jgi:hypothetical protein
MQGGRGRIRAGSRGRPPAQDPPPKAGVLPKAGGDPLSGTALPERSRVNVRAGPQLVPLLSGSAILVLVLVGCASTGALEEPGAEEGPVVEDEAGGRG